MSFICEFDEFTEKEGQRTHHLQLVAASAAVVIVAQLHLMEPPELLTGTMLVTTSSDFDPTQ